MLERLKNNERSLQEHELLEILLFNAIPRKNTNEIAHTLISSFGSIDNVLRATPQQLVTVDGVGGETAAYLRCIGILCKQVTTREESVSPKTGLDDFISFSRERFQYLKEEAIEFYCIDKQDRIIFCKRFTSFDQDKANVKMSELNEFFSAHKPYALIVAHNHPVERSRPSEQDEHFTAQIMTLCSVYGTIFYDHIIFGTDGIYSYFRDGKMEYIRQAFNINNLVNGKLDP